MRKKRATPTPETIQLTWGDGERRGAPMPCLRTIRDCEVTDFGWRGIKPDGTVLNMNVRPWPGKTYAE